MKKQKQNYIPEINAGSMADIAFLLLIFFLVSTTIPNDQGIVRKLPEPCLNGDCSTEINERNVLRISMNFAGELSIDSEVSSMDSLVPKIKEFIDNNGDGSCLYCKGSKRLNASDNPSIAVVSLATDRQLPYKLFIEAQNKISLAYLELREEYAKKVYNKNLSQLKEDEWAQVRKSYPLLLSEAELR